jgi:hypothetical protein
MGQHLTRLGLMDQTRTTAGGSQTGGNPGAHGGKPGAPLGIDPVLAR